VASSPLAGISSSSSSVVLLLPCRVESFSLRIKGSRPSPVVGFGKITGTVFLVHPWKE
jgi:hypothetical protein